MPSTTPVVIRVRGEVIYKHARRGPQRRMASSVAGYRYTAVLMDRSEVILLNNATRRHEWAYQWTVPVARGKARGLAVYFKYSSYRIQPLPALAEFRIEWPSSTADALLRALWAP
jgi:hypothetical protein